MSPVKTQRWWMMATCLMHTSCKHVCILTNNTLMTWLEKSSKVQTQINKKKKHPGQQGCQTADLTQTLSITPVDIWGHFQLFLFRRKAAVFQRKLDHLHPWSWSPEPNHNVFLNLTRAPSQKHSVWLHLWFCGNVLSEHLFCRLCLFWTKQIDNFKPASDIL